MSDLLDQPTCYTLIALLTGACGALLLLWYRAASRLPGEYRDFRPAVELPSTEALGADLYAAYRAGRARAAGHDGGLPRTLDGEGNVERSAWHAVAQHVEAIVHPPREQLPPGATRIGPAVQVRGVAKGVAAIAVLVLAAGPLLLALLAGCGATTTATVIRTTAAGVETLDAVAASVVKVQGEAIRASAAYQDLRKSDPAAAYKLWQQQMASYQALGPAVTAARSAVMSAAHAADAAGRRADRDRGVVTAAAYGLGGLWGVVDVLIAAKVPVPAALTTTARYGCELVAGLMRGLDPKAPVPCISEVAHAR